MVAAATAADKDLIAVMQYVSNGWPSSKTDVASDIRVYNFRTELSVVGQGIPRGCRVAIPSTLRQSLLELAYEGHPGVSRMKSKCHESIWWPGIDAGVEQVVRDCQACVVSSKSIQPSPGPLHPVPLPAGRVARWWYKHFRKTFVIRWAPLLLLQWVSKGTLEIFWISTFIALLKFSVCWHC